MNPRGQRSRQRLARRQVALSERLRAIWQLMRGDQPIGFWLLLWPALWSLWLASGGIPQAHVAWVFVAGVLLTRAGGCAFNDYVDRDIDGRVARTRQRPLARGALAPSSALWLAAALALAAFVLVLTLNTLTVQLAIAAAALAALYPFTKRWLPMPQLVLGLAFAWSAPMAFAAERNALPAELWLLYAAVVAWVIAYDTFYAMADRDDDRAIGLRSSALLFGRADHAYIAALQALSIALLLAAGMAFGRGPWHWAGVGVAAALFVWQQRTARRRERGACLRAFRSNHWVGAAVFAGLCADYLSEDGWTWPL